MHEAELTSWVMLEWELLIRSINGFWGCWPGNITLEPLPKGHLPATLGFMHNCLCLVSCVPVLHSPCSCRRQPPCVSKGPGETLLPRIYESNRFACPSNLTLIVYKRTELRC
ncbi:hypothetical protein M758_3G118700 [Ceratodon purpureus]|nr:hypothetical protein M758_3G118700 [Ceratodon purpureus]